MREYDVDDDDDDIVIKIKIGKGIPFNYVIINTLESSYNEPVPSTVYIIKISSSSFNFFHLIEPGNKALMYI